jgi:hypothetical protein
VKSWDDAIPRTDGAWRVGFFASAIRRVDLLIPPTATDRIPALDFRIRTPRGVTASREKESLVYEEGNGRKAAVLWMKILSVMHEEGKQLRIHLEGKNPRTHQVITHTSFLH